MICQTKHLGSSGKRAPAKEWRFEEYRVEFLVKNMFGQCHYLSARALDYYGPFSLGTRVQNAKKYINMSCEYVCCWQACVNYEMMGYNVRMNMMCYVGGLIWRNCALVMHHLYMNFSSVVCYGPVVGSGTSSYFPYDGNSEMLLILWWVINNIFGVVWFSGGIVSD